MCKYVGKSVVSYEWYLVVDNGTQPGSNFVNCAISIKVL